MRHAPQWAQAGVKPARPAAPGVRRVRGAGFGRAAACILAGVLLLALGGTKARAIDEIQVYDAGINDPGEWSLQLHANYAVDGRKQPDFPGGIVPHHAVQGTPELAYGVTDWWELGLYWPYAFTNTGQYKDGGIKLRTLFVVPHAKDGGWLLGVNFELGYDNPAFATERWNVEVRPIVGYRFGSEEFIVNPILDYALDKHDYRPDFAPAVRYAHAVSGTWKVGLEHYADLGPLDANVPDRQQAHTTFAIAETTYRSVDVHVGIGHGWTRASDETVAKTIVGFSF